MRCNAVQSQAAQKDKLAAADVIVTNKGSYDDLWKQVSKAWKRIAPEEEADPTTQVISKSGVASFSLQRGKPRDLQNGSQNSLRA